MGSCSQRSRHGSGPTGSAPPDSHGAWLPETLSPTVYRPFEGTGPADESVAQAFLIRVLVSAQPGQLLGVGGMAGDHSLATRVKVSSAAFAHAVSKSTPTARRSHARCATDPSAALSPLRRRDAVRGSFSKPARAGHLVAEFSSVGVIHATDEGRGGSHLSRSDSPIPRVGCVGRP